MLKCRRDFEAMFGQYFAADVWLRLNLSQDSEARFGQYFKLAINRDTVVWLRF